MLVAQWAAYRLDFLETAITSRQQMQVKDTYFVRVFDPLNPGVFGVGECPLFKGLSAEDDDCYEAMLSQACHMVSTCPSESVSLKCVPEISSIRFGFEMALNDYAAGGTRRFFDSEWTDGAIRQQINGLVWMGDYRTMAARIRQKLDNGFRCVKLKIGGIDFNEELALLRLIRSEFGSDKVELRLDANGAFTSQNAFDRLDRLASFDIHSIEQPVKPGQWRLMADLCRESPIPIALDEELIGFHNDSWKHEMLETVRPHYLILKPALCGGFAQASRWIELARQYGIGWWATSALESNLGLDAIGQWVSQFAPTMPQGLGTGQLYANNIPSPVYVDGQYIARNPLLPYDLSAIKWRT